MHKLNLPHNSTVYTNQTLITLLQKLKMIMFNSTFWIVSIHNQGHWDISNTPHTSIHNYTLIIRWSDICSGDNCSCDDISDNKELEWGWWLGFQFGVGQELRLGLGLGLGLYSTLEFYRWSKCRRSKCRTFHYSHSLKSLSVRRCCINSLSFKHQNFSCKNQTSINGWELEANNNFHILANT